MQFDYIYFYVENVIEFRDWFREKLGFKVIVFKIS